MSEVDAKIAAAEARTDTKFAEMMGELRVISGKLEHLDENYRETRKSISSVKTTVLVTAVTTIIAIGGLFYTALQYGNSMFSAGLDTQTIAEQSAKNVVLQAEPRFATMNANFERLDKNYQTLQQQIGVILTAVEAQKKNEPAPLNPAPKQ
ncbi:hypothetical protein [Brucella lupini]|uniref:Uncharacterized protein n=1 Tax=Brucella lupini TaxID=255457 RepID=A0A256GGJ4_9HYPH|nr:hypothetical protein [Brucella lupini]KAB2701349.1 hypothetical protein F9L03_24205 [Brucella lupini]OYR26243.1 hypothetical protein CES86_3711 [Brucella lupini]